MTCEVKVKRSGWQQAASRKKHEKANENEKQMKSASAYDIGDAKQLKTFWQCGVRTPKRNCKVCSR